VSWLAMDSTPNVRSAVTCAVPSSVFTSEVSDVRALSPWHASQIGMAWVGIALSVIK